MADELRHENTATGTTLQRTDWEDVDNHRFDSQAQGDMLIATSVTQLSRLGITNDRILVSSGGLFSWANTLPAFIAGGTITIGSNIIDIATGNIEFGAVPATIGNIRVAYGAALGYSRNNANTDNIPLIYLFTGDLIHFGAGIKLEHTLTLNGQAFDAGAGSAEINTTGSSVGLDIISSHTGSGGTTIKMWANSASPAVNDVLGRVDFYGNTLINGGFPADTDILYGEFTLQAMAVLDEAEDARYNFYLMNAGTINLSAYLTGAGALWLDADIDFSTSIDSALVADHVSLGCFDIGGLRSLAISQENPVVVEAIGASDRTLPVRINGTDYKIMLHT